MNKLKKYGLIGVFNNTGIDSQNYKRFFIEKDIQTIRSEDTLMNWLNPNQDIINHKYTVIYYKIFYEDGEEYRNIDIFYFDGISNRFRSKNQSGIIRYKDILKWFPLPSIEE